MFLQLQFFFIIPLPEYLAWARFGHFWVFDKKAQTIAFTSF
jgi:hypothetical protein